jgi:hypothetical protein
LSLHQPRKIFRLLIRELEHDLDLAIGEHAYVRRIFFGEQPMQAFALLENGLSVGFLLLGNLFTSLDFFFALGSQRN